MSRRIPLRPAHPERICWGCDLYCAADDMRCGNGTDRTQHPIEVFGPDWMEHSLPSTPAASVASGHSGTTVAGETAGEPADEAIPQAPSRQ
ncbi:MAG: DUF3079 domain-containing protein [Steroidobacteraceae bacterium]